MTRLRLVVVRFSVKRFRFRFPSLGVTRVKRLGSDSDRSWAVLIYDRSRRPARARGRVVVPPGTAARSAARRTNRPGVAAEPSTRTARPVRLHPVATPVSRRRMVKRASCRRTVTVVRDVRRERRTSRFGGGKRRDGREKIAMGALLESGKSQKSLLRT